MRKRRGRLPRGKQLHPPLTLHAQHASRVDRDDALTREQQAQGVLQPLTANRVYNLSDIQSRAVYRPMEHRDQTGAYAVIIGGLTALWASLPALVKAYLLLATARGLLSVAAGLIARRPAREIARENFAHLIALGAILLIWFSGEMLASEMSDLAQVLVLASKLISLWYAAQSVLEILDDLARLGIPVPESLRNRLQHMLRGGNGEKRHEQDDRRN